MILAPAKINLYLHVTGKRPDSYHLLDSLVVFADAADELRIELAKDFSLEITGEFANLVDINDNSVKKAAESLQKYSGEQGSCKITLKKNLPVGAGIGGGSSDAAATLLVLNDLWKLNLSGGELQKIGLKIGADVPVCLARRSSVMSGIGEEIREIKLPPLNLLLVNPDVQVSTTKVFSMGFDKFSAPAAKVKNFDSLEELVRFLSRTRNDMEENAIKIAPEIAEVLLAISRQKGCLLARMSGSGATCFGIFDTVENSRAAAIAIGKEKKSWWAKATRTFD